MAFNKPDISPRDEIFDVSKKSLTKLTDHFFTIFDLGTASLWNGSLFIKLKENDPLIKMFGPMHIDFDEYTP